MSSSIQVVATITPAPGKEEQVKELLIKLTLRVQENEPGVLKYQAFEQFGHEGATVFVVEETYADEATFDAHFKTEYFQAFGEALLGGSLLSATPEIKKIAPIGGFASR